MTAHKNVYIALAAAQAEMSAPVKGAINPAFKSKYADLSDVVNAAAPALNKHGLCFFHYQTSVDGGRYMVTALVHGESETRIECPVELIVGKNDMQGYKSATTYAKRIGLESVTGLAPADDDGNAAASNPPGRSRLISRTPHDPETGEVIAPAISEAQELTLRDLLAETNSDEAKFLAFFHIGKLMALPADRFAEAERMLLAKQKAVA